MYWNVVLDWFVIGFGLGIVGTETWNETVRDEFAPIVPIKMPLAGFALAIGTPLIVTVLGRKMVPVGMISVNVTLEAGYCRYSLKLLHKL